MPRQQISMIGSRKWRRSPDYALRGRGHTSGAEALIARRSAVGAMRPLSDKPFLRRRAWGLTTLEVEQ
eukprot:6597081-Pyramimonas_sp.AAC.1